MTSRRTCGQGCERGRSERGGLLQLLPLALGHPGLQLLQQRHCPADRWRPAHAGRRPRRLQRRCWPARRSAPSTPSTTPSRALISTPCKNVLTALIEVICTERVRLQLMPVLTSCSSLCWSFLLLSERRWKQRARPCMCVPPQSTRRLKDCPQMVPGPWKMHQQLALTCGSVLGLLHDRSHPDAQIPAHKLCGAQANCGPISPYSNRMCCTRIISREIWQ